MSSYYSEEMNKNYVYLKDLFLSVIIIIIIIIIIMQYSANDEVF